LEGQAKYRSVDLRHVDNSKYISVQLSTVKLATRIILFSPSPGEDAYNFANMVITDAPALPNRPSKFACYPLEHKNPDLQSNGHGTCSPAL